MHVGQKLAPNSLLIASCCLTCPLDGARKAMHAATAVRLCRNAPKCANRKFWEELKLVDARDASSPSEMFASCLEVLERATLSCVTTCNIAVFRPQTPGSKDGPRVWNNQLVR
jgi:nitric oxide synthase oxygenase domain/subunit